MSDELIWLNGEVTTLADARLSVEDRGFQFADGIYEVVRLYDGRPFTLDEHLARLERSADGIALRLPMARQELAGHILRFVERAGVRDGMVYLQVTRGVAPRNHLFPQDARTTTLFYARPLPPVPPAGTAPGVRLSSVPDERWRKCWIKSIALLANVLAKNAAVARGADEGVFVEDGLVSECTASNFFAVSRGRLLTHPVGPKVLPGITRGVILELARELDVPVVERPVSEAEALAADEVFISSTTREIAWVQSWDARPIAPGHGGPITLKLHQALQARVRAEARHS